MILPKFPNEIWDGLSATRTATTEYRTPDAADWAQLIQEIIAIERFILTVCNNNDNSINFSILTHSYSVLGPFDLE